MRVSADEIFERIKKIIVEQLGVDESSVTMDASFIDDLGADSLEIVDLIMAMEGEFNLSIPDEDAENLSTVRDAVEYIRRHSKDNG
ncbi:MAG TPA: acyl carrier protein [Firmicutes bacterium]|nr:acyl carrier protein [Candidatus Fermentithermobacillaceae bacterium]